MKEQFSKHSLFSFFSGHASPLEKRLIEDWLKDAANMEQYYEWLEEWERKYPQYVPQSERALAEFLNKIELAYQHHPKSEDVLEVRTSRRFQWWLVAASLALLIVAALYVRPRFIMYKSYKTDFGELQSLVLEDGSKVFLNANSTLEVPRFGFGERTREVFLQGEAEFSVTHTKDSKKFLVQTPDHLEVEVVGTEFIVYSRSRGSRVVLNKGKVLLRSHSSKSSKELAVKPGDIVTVEKGVFTVKEKQETATQAAWKDHRFVFDHTSVEEIGLKIEEVFGVKIEIVGASLAKRELTGTYEAENAEELLSVLARVLDIQINKRQKKIQLISNK
jgi:ferric-dicitrate binding protein FerR (iron transport regulator)